MYDQGCLSREGGFVTFGLKKTTDILALITDYTLDSERETCGDLGTSALQPAALICQVSKFSSTLGTFAHFLVF